MTTKKKAVIVTVLALLVWGIYGRIFWIPRMGTLAGRYGGGVSGAATVAVKDFEPLGMVFVSADTKSGNGTGAYDLLLKEAQKLGADGIINVRINRQWRLSGADTLTGSALAVKYTEAVAVPAANTGFTGLIRGWGGFGRGF
jgi:hypothetical protein